jgi:hypothetical protein
VPIEIVPTADDKQLVEEIKTKVSPAHRAPAAPALPSLLKPIGAAMNSALACFSQHKEGST